MVIFINKLKIWNEIGNVKRNLGSVIHRFKNRYFFKVKTLMKIQ